MNLSMKILKKGGRGGDKCTARKYSLEEEENGGTETKHTAAGTGNHQALDVYVDHLHYLRPLLCGLRITGMLTWLEQDVRNTTYSRRWKLLLLAGFLRLFHAGVVFLVVFTLVFQGKPRDVAGIVAHIVNMGVPLLSVYFLMVLCYKSPTLARLCGKLVDLDSFFINWQREHPSSQAMKMRRPKMFLTDPIALSMSLLFFLGVFSQLLMYTKSSLMEIMIGIPICFLMNMASLSIFLVVVLYRTVSRLLGYEMSRFLTAALGEGTVLSRVSNRSMMSGISETGGLLFSFSSHEVSEVNGLLNEDKKEKEDEENRRQCPMEVYILGEAFFRLGEIKEDLISYMGLPLCITTFTFSIFIIYSIYESFKGNFVQNTPLLAIVGIFSPLLLTLAICRSPEELRMQAERVDLTLNTLQLRVSCVSLIAQLGLVREALNRIPDFRVGGLFSLGNKVVLSLGGFILTYLVLLLQVGTTRTADHQAHDTNDTVKSPFHLQTEILQSVESLFRK
ncbi:uncharacterized protein LOC135114454 [Scylla paramamosain]|uniref:uncharacterized protein LOC135114454 n=1 Tax=Scylla paramamosain TaxID=85552 RepID=UPI003083E2C0